MISNCLILNNQADEGGACFSRGGTPVFENCWFYLNESIVDGAEIQCVESRPRLIACGFHRDGIQWEDVGLIDVRNDCGVSGACCLQEHCIITTLTACVDAAGVWQGENRLCVPEVCPAFCVEDVNADGRVNMTDVLRVLDSGRCGERSVDSLLFRGIPSSDLDLDITIVDANGIRIQVAVEEVLPLRRFGC